MITKRHKLFSVAFMAALAILLVDRLFILPQGANAAQLESESPQATRPPQVTSDDLLEPSKTRTVAERLERLCTEECLQREKLPDAFSLPAAWLGDVDPNGSLSGRVDQVAEFRQRYELLAVAENNGSLMAFVNHHRLRVGQVLEGFILVEIDDQSATFAGDDGIRFVLRLRKSR